MKVLLFSDDPVALDSIFCKLIDLKPAFVPYMKVGRESGLGTDLYNEIAIVGDNIKGLINNKFKVTRKPPSQFVSAKSFPPFLKNLITPKPVIIYEQCVNCRTCIEQCPVLPKAIYWPAGKKDKKPIYNYKRCIRCFCCQEICPEKAIYIKTPLLGRLIHPYIPE